MLAVPASADGSACRMLACGWRLAGKRARRACNAVTLRAALMETRADREATSSREFQLGSNWTAGRTQLQKQRHGSADVCPGLAQQRKRSQPGGGHGAQEELGAVGVGACGRGGAGDSHAPSGLPPGALP